MKENTATALLFTVIKFSLLKHVLTCHHEPGNATVNCTSRGLTEVPSNTYTDVINVLILTGNNLEILDNNCFGEYPDLSFLYLKKNNIKIVQKQAFEGLDNLVVLDLSVNKITFFYPTSFVSNAKLETLNLSDNPLKISSSQLIDSTSISTLLLSNTNLTQVSKQSFSGLKNLELLDLKSNSLESLPVDFFDNLPSLQRVYLHGNPWRCDDVAELFISKRDVIADYKKIRCVTSDGQQHELSISTVTSSQQVVETSGSSEQVVETSGSIQQVAKTSASKVTKQPRLTTHSVKEEESGEGEDDDEDYHDDSKSSTINYEEISVFSDVIIYMYIGMILIIFIAFGVVTYLLREALWNCFTNIHDRNSKVDLRAQSPYIVRNSSSRQRSSLEPIYESIPELPTSNCV